MTYQAKSYGRGSKHHRHALQFQNNLMNEVCSLRLIGLSMGADFLSKHHAFVWENELPYWQPASKVCPKLIVTSKTGIEDQAVPGEIADGFYVVDLDNPDDHSITILQHKAKDGNLVILWDTYIHELAHALAPSKTDYDVKMHHGHTPAWLQSFVRLLQRFCQYNEEFDRKQAGVKMRELIMKHLKKNNLEKEFPDGVMYRV